MADQKWEEHEKERIASKERLKATWDSIIDKYSCDFGDETDIIDLSTGIPLLSLKIDKFILDNGALDRTPAKPFGSSVDIGSRLISL